MIFIKLDCIQSTMVHYDYKVFYIYYSSFYPYDQGADQYLLKREKSRCAINRHLDILGERDLVVTLCVQGFVHNDDQSRPTLFALRSFVETHIIKGTLIKSKDDPS